MWPIGGGKRRAEGGEGSAPLTVEGEDSVASLVEEGEGGPAHHRRKGERGRRRRNSRGRKGEHDARETQSNTSKYGGVGSALRMRGSG